MCEKSFNFAGISYRDEVRRKLVHLSSLWMVAAMLTLPRLWLIILFGVMTLLCLLTEHAYAAGNGYVIRIYDVFFRNMLRNPPQPGQWIISGGPYVLMAAFMCVLLFCNSFAAAAMAVMLTGDTAAALTGRTFGRHKCFNGKSWEGFAAFCFAGFAGAAAVLALSGAGWYLYIAALAGTLLAAAAELFEKQLRIDDNFSIPLVVGGTLWAVSVFLQ